MSDFVETLDDWESLPVGTIVRVGPDPESIIVRAEEEWLKPGDDRPVTAEVLRQWDCFPAEIIYRPQGSNAAKGPTS